MARRKPLAESNYATPPDGPKGDGDDRIATLSRVYGDGHLKGRAEGLAIAIAWKLRGWSVAQMLEELRRMGHGDDVITALVDRGIDPETLL
jgi:hypothetical protein